MQKDITVEVASRGLGVAGKNSSYMRHVLRTMAKRILVGSPFSRSVLGKDLKVVPAGPSTVIWKAGIPIVKKVQRDVSR